MTTLVLVHGSRLNAAAWGPLVANLPGYDVLDPDLPGHGGRAGEPFTMDGAETVVAEAVAASRAVGDGRAPVVVGHSLGGIVALRWAARARRGDLAGLVLLGATTGRHRALAAPYRIVGSGLRAALSTPALARFVIAGDAAIIRRAMPAGDEIVERGSGVRSIPQAWDAAVRAVDPDLPSSVPAPILAVNGEYDQFRTGEAALLQARPDATVRHVPGSHLAVLTHPAEVAVEIDDFVSGLA